MFTIFNKKGFTLIEMLIVIAIIGILASIVLVGLGPVQRQGRDARRISDLRQVQNALELYFNKNGAYPIHSSTGPTDSTTWGTLTTDITGASIGVLQIPIDPKTGQSYMYASDGTTYVLGAQLEDTGNQVLVSDIDTNPISGAFSCADPVYCIQL